MSRRLCVGAHPCAHLRKMYNLRDEPHNICINYSSNTFKTNTNIRCMTASRDCLTPFTKYRQKKHYVEYNIIYQLKHATKSNINNTP